MAKIPLPKGSGKGSKVSEKSGNFEKDIERQPCMCERHKTAANFRHFNFLFFL